MLLWFYSQLLRNREKEMGFEHSMDTKSLTRLNKALSEEKRIRSYKVNFTMSNKSKMVSKQHEPSFFTIYLGSPVQQTLIFVGKVMGAHVLWIMCSNACALTHVIKLDIFQILYTSESCVHTIVNISDLVLVWDEHTPWAWVVYTEHRWGKAP